MSDLYPNTWSVNDGLETYICDRQTFDFLFHKNNIFNNYQLINQPDFGELNYFSTKQTKRIHAKNSHSV